MIAADIGSPSSLSLCDLYNVISEHHVDILQQLKYKDLYGKNYSTFMVELKTLLLFFLYIINITFL